MILLIVGHKWLLVMGYQRSHKIDEFVSVIPEKK